jgi:hypothetical protein
MIIENIENMFVTGDFHGENDISKISMERFPQQKKLNGNNILFQVGDFGIIWKNEKDKSEEYWLKWLDDKPFYTLFIAGNHENYDRLEKYSLIDFHGGKAAQISNKVFYLQNGYVYDFEGLKIWMFGGGTSIDKSERIQGLSWWPQEIPSYKEMDFGSEQLKNNNCKVDYIFTHTMPELILRRNIGKNLGGNAEKKINYLYLCPVGNYLNHIYKMMKSNYKQWYFGHYHFDQELDKNFTGLYQRIHRIYSKKGLK